MGFWIFALALAALAALVLVLAFRRGSDAAPAPAASDLGVYRDQLSEVERDLARGVVSPEEADRTRLEVSRRLLDADKAVAATQAARPAPRALTQAAAALLALAVIGGAALLYARLGAPDYPDQPMQARLAMADEMLRDRPTQAEREAVLPAPPPPQDVEQDYLDMMQRLREVVAERPEDRRGLELLAHNEALLGNFSAAHAAQAKLIALKGDGAEAQDYATLADLLILAARGYVSPEAETALAEALKRDPANPFARYYQGLLFAQVGRPDLGFAVWDALLNEGPPDAPWIAPIRQQIEDLAYMAGQFNFVLPPAAEMRGPGAADVEAAEQMSPEERGQMIRSMVEGLAARLASEGGPASDWARLIRAYGVLGEPETARPILEEARSAFAQDPAGLAEIESAARDAGLAR